MLYFLYGQDTYRSRQKLNEVIGQYKTIHKSGLNLQYFEGEDLTFDKFSDAIQQISMFDEKKLIVVANTFANQDFKEKFLKNSKSFIKSKDIILFYEEKEVSEKDKLFKFLKKEAKSQEFQPLAREKLKNWIKKELMKFGAKGIDEEGLNKLIDYVGNDLWQISNEIKKLVNFKENKKINGEDVELLVKPKIEADIFRTIDAIASKNKKQAIFLIRKHLDKGDSPLYLFSMINFQFRNLLVIKDLIERQRPYYAILKITKLHPFVVKKSYEQAVKFTLPELKKIYQKIFQADLSIKTGRMEPETALDLFLTEL
ncbi:MAG: DNA polymerase III subunit delta [Candidatus Pacebacteria bacterium]|nr:DNA polymerase III subunit delta [Candidatus Paceibacterota bacterium]